MSRNRIVGPCWNREAYDRGTLESVGEACSRTVYGPLLSESCNSSLHGFLTRHSSFSFQILAIVHHDSGWHAGLWRESYTQISLLVLEPRRQFSYRQETMEDEYLVYLKVVMAPNYIYTINLDGIGAYRYSGWIVAVHFQDVTFIRGNEMIQMPRQLY